jgi:phosphatidylglycerophosphatase A
LETRFLAPVRIVWEARTRGLNEVTVTSMTLLRQIDCLGGVVDVADERGHMVERDGAGVGVDGVVGVIVAAPVVAVEVCRGGRKELFLYVFAVEDRGIEKSLNDLGGLFSKRWM